MPSSVIAHMSYDAASQVLQVTYVSGSIYEYQQVPPEIYEAMRTSGAKGIYLNKHIKGNYSYKKIK